MKHASASKWAPWFILLIHGSTEPSGNNGQDMSDSGGCQWIHFTLVAFCLWEGGAHTPPFFWARRNLCHVRSCYRNRLHMTYGSCCVSGNVHMDIKQRVGCELRTHHQLLFLNLIFNHARHASPPRTEAEQLTGLLACIPCFQERSVQSQGAGTK